VVAAGRPTATDCDGRCLIYKVAPILNATMVRSTNQAGQNLFVICDQRLRATRGGVIVRVYRSMRQKSNRPLRCI
jgi:hypothetical protein